VLLALGLLISCATNPSYAADKKKSDAAEQKPAEVVPASQLVVTSASTLSPAEVAQLDAQSTIGTPLTLAGHGLVLEVRWPANVTMATPEGNLVVSRTLGTRAVTRATVVVGSAAATKAPARVGETTKYETGPNGPTIELEPQLSALDQVFSKITPTPSESGNWRVRAEGPVSFAFQPGTTLMTVPAGGEMQFVVALGTSTWDQAWLAGPFKKSATLEPLVFEGAKEVGRGQLGTVQWLDLRYTDQGEAFAERLFLVPYGTESMLLLKTRAHEAINDRMVKVASDMVSSYSSAVQGP
jgi:hypothetical protein